MRFLLIPILFLSTVFARAAAYTAGCAHETMHVGDLVPPGVYTVVNNAAPTVQVGAGLTVFATPPPPCTQSATSGSGVGSYTSTMNTGTLANPGTDTITYVNGTTVVIAPDSIGAKLVNAFIPNNGATSPPPGFFSTLPWAVLETTSNPVCNIVASSTDQTDCLQYQIAAQRGAQTATVKCSGSPSVVTASAGTPFTGITGGTVNINGSYFTIGSVTDATHMTLTTMATAAQCSTSSVTIYLPRTMVAVTAGSTAVSWVSGPQLGNLLIANENIALGFQTGSKIASVTDATDIVLQNTFTLPNVTGTVPLYVATNISGGGAGGQPLYLHIAGCATYNFSHAINTFGAYMTIWGDGPDCSIIKLLPNSADFGPSVSATCFLCINPVGANQTFHVFVRNLGVEVGPGNPKAIPVNFPASNYGALRNDQFWCDDSLCPIGINLGKNETGPEMMYNVADYGATDCISSTIPEYNATGEYLTLEGCTTLGILNNANRLQFRKTLLDVPSVLAFMNTSAGSSAAFMNSEIFANGATACLQNSTSSGTPSSSLFLKDVNVHGSCTTSVNDWGTGTLVSSTGNIAEQSTGTWQSLFDSGSPGHSLGLPIIETPQANDPAVSTWSQLSGTDPTQWQTELNACLSTTYFTAPAVVPGSGTIGITVPGCVNHLQFFDAMTPTPGSTYHIIFTIADSSTTPLIFEDCPQNQCAINHTGSRPIVMLDENSYNYATSPGAGNLFCDDCILGGNLNSNGGVTFQASQNCWMRQSNQEQPTQPKLTFLGGTCWIFGQKTEHNGPNLTLSAGSQVEVYGFTALGDPTVQGAGGTVVNMTDSSLFMTGTMSTQCTITQPTGPCNNAFYFWVNENRGASNLSLAIPFAQTVGNSQNLNGPYYSYGAPQFSINTMGGSATVGGSAAVQ